MLARKLVTRIFFSLCVFFFTAISFAKEKDVYSIVINNHSYPYHFLNSEGQAEGMMVDIWRLWASKNGKQVEFVATSWKDTLQSIRDGSVDIHAGLSQTKERANYMSFSKPFFKHGSYIFVHRDLGAISSIEALRPYTIGVPQGSSHDEQIPSVLPDASIRFYDGRHNVYEAALRGELVAFAGLERISKNYDRQSELNRLFPPYRRINYLDGNYVAAVTKGRDDLLAVINKGMEKITDQEKSAIERKWLGIDKRRDAVTLVFVPEFHPYINITLNGKAEGLLVDLWRLWSEQTGRDVQFVARDFQESFELLKEREADIHIAYPDVGFDKQKFVSAEQKYQVSLEIFIANEFAKNVNSIEDMSGLSVGTFTTAQNKFDFVEQFKDLNIEVYKTYQELLTAVELGNVQAVIGEFETMNFNITRQNFQSSFIKLPDFRLGVDLHTLMIKDNVTLLNMVNEGFKNIPQDKLLELEDKWLNKPSNGYFSRSINLVNLSKQEQQYLQNKGEIKVGVHTSFAPVEFYDEESGKLAGINLDYLELIHKRTGAQFKLVAFDNWHQQYEALISGEVDLLASVTKTQSREDALLFSNSYWQMPYVVIHRKSSSNNVDIESFYGKSLAVVKGYHLVQEIREKYPKVNLKLVESLEEGIVAVERGLAAGVVENIATASEVIKNERLIDLSINVLNELPMDDNRFAVRNDDSVLRDIINKSLLTIGEEDSQKVYEKWFSINLQTGFDKSTVFKVAAQVSIVIILVIVFFTTWNRRLYSEVNQRKVLEAKMKHMATHDELTGLPNRVLLKDRLATAISLHKRQKLSLAVMFIDLDGFKLVNDTYGHDAGDELLTKVAKRLEECIRESDTVVRFGGDEFIVLLNSLNDSNEATFVADKIIAAVKAPVTLTKSTAQISCSIGVAMYPQDADNQSDLLKIADTLMYEIKQTSKNSYKLSH